MQEGLAQKENRCGREGQSPQANSTATEQSGASATLPRLRESLAGTTMVYIDDRGDQAKAMSEAISLLYDAVAITVHHTGQSYEEIGKHIQAKLAEMGRTPTSDTLILMSDGNLAGDMCGWDLLKHLKTCFPDAICAGFSGLENGGNFAGAGVNLFFKKPCSLVEVERCLLEECRKSGK